MFGFAETKSSSSSLSNPDSPQYKAVEWLAQDKVDNESNWSGYELLQRYVLRVLYHSTDGENWSGSPCCFDADTTWFGASMACGWGSDDVRCGGSGQQVDYIDLSNGNLRGTIPTELGLLTALSYLSLYDNRLTGTIPTALTQLNNLYRLYLHKNSLIGQVPSVFCASPFPDWRADGRFGNGLSADCISEVQCDCCDLCYDESNDCFYWNGSGFSSC